MNFVCYSDGNITFLYVYGVLSSIGGQCMVNCSAVTDGKAFECNIAFRIYWSSLV